VIEDDFLPECVCHVRMFCKGGPLQPRNPPGGLQGPHHPLRWAADDGEQAPNGCSVRIPRRRKSACAPW